MIAEPWRKVKRGEPLFSGGHFSSVGADAPVGRAGVSSADRMVGGRGTVFAAGTPISDRTVETYHRLRI